MTTWVEGRVTGMRRWTDDLCSVQVDAPAVTFVAGQFARLALPALPGDREAMVGRPYSFVNPPHQAPHEFYFIVVAGGPLSPRLAALGPGDPLWLGPRANGFFSIPEVPRADALWCVSTGTGIGPFLSMLRSDDTWEKYGRVVLVHGVRHARELTYQDAIADVRARHAGAFAYVPMVTREPHPPAASNGGPNVPAALHGRIPAAITDGRLESRAGVPLTPDNAQVMLCGNPAMVDDAQQVLAARGMRRHRRRDPGHVTIETYW